ncbi:MAG TPA: FHA domain-containing protein [Nannocystis sp.]|jgi:pSer/pThr/pTyr-binding forkhead associated (FHA) protein
MAKLHGPDGQRLDAIAARCIVGRSRACELVLDARDVSSEHAAIRWNGTAWELEDLGSRNGTFVDGQRLPPRTIRALERGRSIRFANTLGAWLFVDDAPPQPMAINLVDRRMVHAGADALALPDRGAPEVWLRHTDLGQWVAEREDATAVRVEDQEVLLVGGQPWRLYLPSGAPATWQGTAAVPGAGPLRLRFRVAADEEYIELVACHDERTIDLKARAHHYPLLLLARARLADQAAGSPEDQQGWMLQDRLQAMLKVDANSLNVSIHRIRVQLTQAGVPDAAHVVERRPGTRQLRLGVAAITIEPL